MNRWAVLTGRSPNSNASICLNWIGRPQPAGRRSTVGTAAQMIMAR
jgi:hypothetical protein